MRYRILPPKSNLFQNTLMKRAFASDEKLNPSENSKEGEEKGDNVSPFMSPQVAPFSSISMLSRPLFLFDCHEFR